MVVNEGTVVLGALGDSCQNSRLGDGELLGVLSEVTDGSQLYAVCGAAEADVIEVLLKYLVLGVGLFQLHGGEYLSYLTLRGALVVSRQVLDELLCDSRTALFRIIEVEEHIEEGGECTLVVNTVMDVESLVLGVNESIADVLGYLVDSDRDTLEVVLVLVEENEFLLAVCVGLVAVEVGIASRFKLLKGYAGGVVHEVEDVDRQRGTYYGSRDDDDQQQ